MKKDRIPLMRLRKSVPAVMIYGSFLLAMVLTLSQKHNYYVDEMFTYGQANHQGSKEFGIEDGVIYAPALRPFMEFLSVSPESVAQPFRIRLKSSSSRPILLT